MRSWRTSIFGFLGGITVMIFGFLMLNGPNNEIGIAMIVSGAGLLGVGWSARDNRVSSEDVGQDEGARRRRKSLGKFIPALAVLAGVMVGCSPAVTQTDISGADINTENQGDQVAKMFIDDNGEPAILTKLNGLGPTVWMMDAEGIWGATQGPGGLVAYNPATKQIYIWSPKDAKIARFEAKADGSVVIEGLELNISDPLAQYVAAFNKAADVLLGMTQEEAKKQIEQWRTSGEVAASVLDALLQIVVPHLPGAG